MTAGPPRPGGSRRALPGDCGRGLPTGQENRSPWRHAGQAAVVMQARRLGRRRRPSACSTNQSTAAWVRSSQATTLNPVCSSALSGDDVIRDEPSTGLQDASNLAIEPPGGRRCSSRNAASRRGRRLRRWNRDPAALKNAFQRRDAGGDIAFPAVFQRHSGFQGPGITVRVVAVI